MKITFCIVTYQKDFDLIKRLIHSIENNWDHSCIEEIIVVINDTTTLDISSNLKLNLIYNPIPTTDWYSQQVIKLQLAKYVNTEYFIIHDSKDYYTSGKKIDLSYYFKDNKSIGSWAKAPNYTHFLKEFKNAYNFWNLNFNTIKGKLNEHTPIVCKKEIMLDLLNELKDIDLLEKIENHTFTEFSLISAYIEYKQLSEKIYITIEDDLEMFSRIQPRVQAKRSLQILK